MYRRISSPGHRSSSVQDPSNTRKYSIYPPQRRGSQDKKAAGPGVVAGGAARVRQSCRSPSRLHPTPPAPQQLTGAWAQPGSRPSVGPSPRQQPAAGIAYGIWTLRCTQIRRRFICKNRAGIFQRWHRLLTGLRKRDFFPPACYKTIVNGNCNLSTLNKWGSCILKLISHHQPLPNNNNYIADGPVSRR